MTQVMLAEVQMVLFWCVGSEGVDEAEVGGEEASRVLQLGIMADVFIQNRHSRPLHQFLVKEDELGVRVDWIQGSIDHMNRDESGGQSTNPSVSVLIPLVNKLQDTVHDQVPIIEADPCPHVQQLSICGLGVWTKHVPEPFREHHVVGETGQHWREEAGVLEELLKESGMVCFWEYASIGQTEAVDGQVSSPVVVTPVEQFQGHSVSIVMGEQVNPLLHQTQVGHQRLHNTGLLKDGVAVGPRFVTEAKTKKVQSNDTVKAPIQGLPYLVPVQAGGREAMEENDHIRAAYSTIGLSVEYIVAPESEECSGRAPGQEGWRQLGRRDVQVDRQQRNAQQAHKKPPFPHLSLGRRAGLAFRTCLFIHS